MDSAKESRERKNMLIRRKVLAQSILFVCLFYHACSLLARLPALTLVLLLHLFDVGAQDAHL